MSLKSQFVIIVQFRALKSPFHTVFLFCRWRMEEQLCVCTTFWSVCYMLVFSQEWARPVSPYKDVGLKKERWRKKRPIDEMRGGMFYIKEYLKSGAGGREWTRKWGRGQQNETDPKKLKKSFRLFFLLPTQTPNSFLFCLWRWTF